MSYYQGHYEFNYLIQVKLFHFMNLTFKVVIINSFVMGMPVCFGPPIKLQAYKWNHIYIRQDKHVQQRINISNICIFFSLYSFANNILLFSFLQLNSNQPFIEPNYNLLEIVTRVVTQLNSILTKKNRSYGIVVLKILGIQM